jgi:hypothetical protein
MRLPSVREQRLIKFLERGGIDVVRVKGIRLLPISLNFAIARASELDEIAIIEPHAAAGSCLWVKPSRSGSQARIARGH